MTTGKKEPTGTKGCASHVALAAPFVPVGVANWDKRVHFVPDDRTSRPGILGWETGIKRISQPRQIKVSVVV